jgi:putative endonuclease
VVAVRGTDAVGRHGERVAERFLVERGAAVLARNWRCRAGEIDLVLLHGDALVAVEVKTRRGEAFGDPLEAITARKLARLRRLVARFADEHRDVLGGRAPEIRVDAVSVLLPARGAAVVRHVQGVG